MNFKLKQKLTIKNAILAVSVGFRIHRVINIVQWLCENIPW